MRKTVLSVIIPYYNGETYLENTVKSILNSTLKDLEILLINDGSPGSSGDFCDYLAYKYDNLRVIHKENGGIADARNRGVREATGKYIAFVDQDDTIDPNMYLSLINILEQYNCDLISSNFYITNIITGERELAGTIKKNKLLLGDEIRELRKWLVMGEVMPDPKVSISPNIWNCVFTSDLIKRNNICFESFIRYDDDWVFLLRYLAHSKRVFLCEQAFYNWLIHDDSESHSARYLPDIVKKYQNLKQFKMDYIKNWCNVTDEETILFAAYFNINTIYVTICNEAVSGNKLSVSRHIIRNTIYKNSTKSKLNEIEQSAKKALIKKKGKRAGMIYNLAIHHFYYMSLFACRIK